MQAAHTLINILAGGALVAAGSAEQSRGGGGGLKKFKKWLRRRGGGPTQPLLPCWRAASPLWAVGHGREDGGQQGVADRAGDLGLKVGHTGGKILQQGVCGVGGQQAPAAALGQRPPDSAGALRVGRRGRAGRRGRHWQQMVGTINCCRV